MALNECLSEMQLCARASDHGAVGHQIDPHGCVCVCVCGPIELFLILASALGWCLWDGAN